MRLLSFNFLKGSLTSIDQLCSCGRSRAEQKGSALCVHEICKCISEPLCTCIHTKISLNIFLPTYEDKKKLTCKGDECPVLAFALDQVLFGFLRGVIQELCMLQLCIKLTNVRTYVLCLADEQSRNVVNHIWHALSACLLFHPQHKVRMRAIVVLPLYAQLPNSSHMSARGSYSLKICVAHKQTRLDISKRTEEAIVVEVIATFRPRCCDPPGALSNSSSSLQDCLKTASNSWLQPAPTVLRIRPTETSTPEGSFRQLVLLENVGDDANSGIAAPIIPLKRPTVTYYFSYRCHNFLPGDVEAFAR